jgi:hypothetical protein
MNEMTLHPTPRFRDVVLEQIRVVAVAFRREGLALAVFMAIGSMVIAVATVQGTAATWFDSDEWVPVIYVAFLFSLAAWWREKPFESGFLWTLPVDRRRLAFAKVLAGWLWLMTAQATFTAWENTLASLSGVPRPQTMPLIAFAGATAAYLLGSALVFGLRHPLRWLLGAAGVLFLLHRLDEVLSRGPYGLQKLLESSGLISAFEDPESAWTYALLGASVIALWFAISRHKETR